MCSGLNKTHAEKRDGGGGGGGGGGGKRPHPPRNVRDACQDACPERQV